MLLPLEQRHFQFELAVEVIFDDAFVAAGDEDEMLDAGLRASSTTCWISGRSTTGSISFGMALVAGRNRVPSPATGKTALRTGFMGGREGKNRAKLHGSPYCSNDRSKSCLITCLISRPTVNGR